MKRILLLGGFGFIATNFLDYISRNCDGNYKVVIFDHFDRHPRGISFNCVEKVYSGDFNDELNLNRVFEENKIDIVLHFLSSTVPATSRNAIYDVETNLVSTLKLLDVMLQHNVKDIMYLSSGGAIYGDVLQKVHNEEDAVYPKSSYGVVKLAIEKYLLSYSEVYGFNSLILRLSNPFGPYHYNTKQGVINVAIRKALSGESLQIWGTGDGVKDYIYIEDACRIMIQLMESGIHTSVYNIASGHVLSVKDIVGLIKNEIPSFKYEFTQALANDVQSFELDITKIRMKLGVLKMTDLAIAIKRTIEWQQNNLV